MIPASDAARAHARSAGSARIGDRYVLARVDADGVCEAFDDALSRPVDVHLRRITSARRRARFQRASLAASHIAHPNIVHVYDFGVERGVSFVVVERLAGATLHDEIDSGGAMHWPRAVHVLRQLCAAVAATHDKGHQGQCVADLDAAHVRLCDVEGMRDFVKVRVDPFRRPDAPRDVRALGRLAWRLLTGGAMPSTTLRATRVRAHVDVPPALDDVVMSALDVRRAHRPSALEMLIALRALMPGR